MNKLWRLFCSHDIIRYLATLPVDPTATELAIIIQHHQPLHLLKQLLSQLPCTYAGNTIN